MKKCHVFNLFLNYLLVKLFIQQIFRFVFIQKTLYLRKKMNSYAFFEKLNQFSK